MAWPDCLIGVFNAPYIGNMILLVVTYVILKIILNVIQFVRIYILCQIFDLERQFSEAGEWAIVTGATDGIGREFAFALAKRGLNIVLISRNEEKLANTANELIVAHSIQVRRIQVDFQERNIYNKISTELDGLDISLLVNNVGMTQSACLFHQEGNGLLEKIVNTNSISMATLSKIVIGKMLSNHRRGSIINVSSMLSDHGFLMGTTYAASKAFISRLSRDLTHVYGSFGITIQTLLPGSVYTKMLPQFAANQLSTKMISLMSPSATDYVSWALRMHGHASECYGHPWHILQACFLFTTPKFVLDKIALHGVKERLQ